MRMRAALGVVLYLSLATGCSAIFGLDSGLPLEDEGGQAGGGAQANGQMASSGVGGASTSGGGATHGGNGANGAASGTTTTSGSMATTGSGGSGSGGSMFCVPDSTIPCYTGPPNTENVGICEGGEATCNAQGTDYGPCQGETVPLAEQCATPEDDDCSGQANEGCASLTCNLYGENFDDGTPNSAFNGMYLVEWCDTYLPGSANTPLCMMGRTMRTNTSTEDPTIWIHQGNSGCTEAKVTFTYYQFFVANVTIEYLQSGDTMDVCEKLGNYTAIKGFNVEQNCTQETVTVPFGLNKSVYVRFNHGAGSNAMWIDDLSIELTGCSC